MSKSFRVFVFFLSAVFWVLFSWVATIKSVAASHPQAGYQNQLAEAIEAGDSLQMARIYRSAGIDLMYQSSYTEAMKLLEEGLVVARQINNPRAIASFLNLLAECNSKLGNYPVAFELYEEVGDIYLSIPDSVGYAGLLINVACEYQDLGDHRQAIQSAIKAIQVKEETRDSMQLAFFYIKMAELLEAFHYESYEQWLFRAYALIRNPNHSAFYTTITIYNNLGQYYKRLDKTDMAMLYYDSVYVLSRQYGHTDGMEVGLSNLAMLAAQNHDYARALELHKEAILISEQGQNVFRRVGHLINAGKLENMLGNFRLASDYFRQGLGLSELYGFSEYTIQGWLGLSRAYRELGDWQKAYQSVEKYNTLKDSIEGMELKATILELRQQYESEKKIKEIERLTIENLLVSQREGFLRAIILVGLLLALSIAVIMVLRFRRVRQEKEIAIQRREVYRLNQENLRLTVDQKNRELSTMVLKMTQNTECLNQLKLELIKTDPQVFDPAIKRIEAQMLNSSQWDTFRLYFEEVHPGFFRRLKEHCPGISQNEERLCAFLKMNMSSKEIALLNSNTVAAVDKSRNRLRKKLEIDPEMNLKTYLDSL